MKFKSKAAADPEILKNLNMAESDSTVAKEVKEGVAKFWADWKEDKKNDASGSG